MAGTVMPAPKFVGLDNNANPVSGGKLYTYVAGTTTPQPTYSDVNLTVANANPVILDSAGRATVFLSGSSYKFVLTDADDVTIWTQDNVQAVAPFSTNLDILGVAGEAILAGQACYLSDGSGALTAGRWYLADSDNAYSSSLPQIAIAPDAVESGESGTFRLQGSVTKSNAQADFVVGDVYYIAATPGQLSATPGTNVRVMGQADSTTTLVISPNPPNIADTPTFIDGITVTSTDAGAAAAPYLDLYRESASPAASDQIGEIRFTGEDSAGNKQLYGRVYGQIADPTSASEDGQVRISTMRAGTETVALVLDETGQLLPDTANQALGSGTKAWADLFLESGGVVNWNAGDTTLTHASGKLTLAGSGAGTLEVKGDILPTVSNTPALGSTSLMWADLFLGSGAVINWNAGNATLTHSAGLLTSNVPLAVNSISAYGASGGLRVKSASGSVIGAIEGTNSAGYSLFRISNDAATGYTGLQFGVNGATTAAIYASEASLLSFETNGSVRMTLTSTGQLKTSSTVSVGNATPSTSGAGITFPAAQSASSDANTLDDYEEGTFTATLKGSTTDPTTPVTTTGRYTKIGRQVTAIIYFSSVTTTGASGAAYIIGLPFTSATGVDAVGAAWTESFDFNGGTSLAAYLPGNSTAISIYVSGNNAAVKNLLHSAGSNRFLHVAITYFV